MFNRFLTKSLTIFFRLLYHSFSWCYDFVASFVSVGLWNHWVLACLPYLQNGNSILELGFGPGHLLQSLYRQRLERAQNFPGQPYRIAGLDESRQMARQCFRSLNKISGVKIDYANFPTLVRGLAQSLPFPDASFDRIVTTFPTPYIINPETLREIYRTLTPGGSLWIVLSAEFTSRRLPYRLASLLFTITGQATSAAEASSIIDHFTSAGFQTVSHWEEQPGGDAPPISKVQILEVRKLIVEKE